MRTILLRSFWKGKIQVNFPSLEFFFYSFSTKVVCADMMKQQLVPLVGGLLGRWTLISSFLKLAQPFFNLRRFLFQNLAVFWHFRHQLHLKYFGEVQITSSATSWLCIIVFSFIFHKMLLEASQRLQSEFFLLRIRELSNIDQNSILKQKCSLSLNVLLS